jgi:hypothetical protein
VRSPAAAVKRAPVGIIRPILGCIAPYLTPDFIGDAISEAMKRLGSRAAVATERTRLEQDLKAVDAEITHLLGFIKRGQASEAVQQELGKTEARRRDLRTALDRLAQADAFRTSTTDFAAKLTAILADWVNITRKPVPQQRQLLRKLVPDRIVVTPHVRGDRKWVDWHGSMALAPIVSGITPALGDVLGMDERWWPQRDSNPCFSHDHVFARLRSWLESTRPSRARRDSNMQSARSRRSGGRRSAEAPTILEPVYSSLGIGAPPRVS